eukprot:Skav209629  [mRNA]  locus=scaffold4224:82940:87399:+ [translate_table: standard]
MHEPEIPLGDYDDEEEEKETLAILGLNSGDYKLPYKVGTIKDGLNQRVYWDEEGGGEPEWLWGRAHEYCKVAIHASKMLSSNRESILTEFRRFEVPDAELHYRQLKEQQERVKKNMWKEHTLDSRGLLVLLLWCMKNRALSSQSKRLALTLAQELIQLGLVFAATYGAVTWMCSAPTNNDELHQVLLQFSQQGVTHNWADVLRAFQPALNLWKKLQMTTWMDYCLCSSPESATIKDIFFFISYIAAHPSLKVLGKNMLNTFGKLVGAQLFFHAGSWLTSYAKHRCTLAMEALPLSRSRAGVLRRALDPVNRMLLLAKLKHEKLHRARIARTHDELAPKHLRLIRYEAYLEVFLYAQLLQKCFKGRQQLSVCWDPSTYGGKETLVSTVYSPDLDIAAYLLNQQITKLLLSDLHESLLPLAKQRKLTRLAGYNEVKGLSHALCSIGVNLMDYVVPKGLVLRPVTARELVVKDPTGRHLLYNMDTQAAAPMVPDHIDLAKLPVLVSISDQGPVNVPALNYMMYSAEALLVTSQWDVYHRCWNDIKLAGKRSLCKIWSVILQLTLLFNVNYGPFGSGSWFHRKRSTLEEFLATHSHTSPCFDQYQSLICLERGLPEPHDVEGKEALFNTLANLKNFNQKGPLVKLMRWFSFFETALYWEGEFFASKMILEERGETLPGDNDKDINLPDQADAQQELRELKKRLGTWKLQSRMVTPKNLAAKDILLSVGKAAWKHHSARARDTKSALDTLAWNIDAAGNKGWAEELEEMLKASLWDPDHLQHLFDAHCLHKESLKWHLDFFDKLLEARAMSLVSFNTLPPNKYNHSLSQDPAIARAAHQSAIKDYQALLEAESAAAAGGRVDALSLVHWRLNPVARAVLLAYDQDEHLGLAGTFAAKGPALQKVLAQNLGDSRMVEVAHQFGKDLLRGSRSKTFGNVTIMANTIRSKALEERQTPTLQFSQAQKIMKANLVDQGSKKEGVAKALVSKGHHLPKEIQNMMLPKTQKANSWPSPNPASIFQSVAASEWLALVFSDAGGGGGADANDAWASVLAQPGQFVAHIPSSSLWKVVASAEYGFLAWLATVEMQQGERFFVLKPNRACLQWKHIVDLQECDKEIQAKEDDISSELSEIISELGQDEFNQQDLKEYKKKKKVQRMKRKLGELDKPVQGRGKKGKGRGKGKGKGKGPGKEKGKGAKKKRTFMSKFAKKMGEEEGQAGGGQEKVEEVAEKDEGQAGDGQEKVEEVGEKDASGASQALEPSSSSKGPAKAEVTGEASGEASQAPEPSSSSKGPSQPESKEHLLVNYEAIPKKKAEKTEKGAGSKEPEAAVKRPREPKHKSPDEILSQLAPPTCYIGLSATDHRFTSTMKAQSDLYVGRMKQQTMTCSFGARLSWQDALRSVHEFNWRKWHVVKAEHPLREGQVEQVPGSIPNHFFEQLESHIQSLPPKKAAKAAKT